MSKKSKKRQAAAQTQKSSAGQSQQMAASSQSQKSNAASQPQKAATSTPAQKSNGSESKKATGSRTNKAAAPLSFPQRLIGAVTLKPEVYREIARDTNGTLQAGIIVVVVALVVGIIGYLGYYVQVPGAADATRISLSRGIVLVIQELLLWGIGGFLIAAVAKNMFQGKTDTGEMLRVFGYSRIFQILLVLGVFGGVVAALVSIAGLALSIAASVIGIRAATGFTTGRAILVGVVTITLVAVVIAFFTAFVLNPFVTTLLPT